MAQDKVTKVNALIDQLGVVNRTANGSAEFRQGRYNYK